MEISPAFAFLLLAVAAFGCAVLGIVRYGDVINPLTAYTVTQVGLYALFSGVINYYDPEQRSTLRFCPDWAVVHTILLELIYLGGLLLAFQLPAKGLIRLYGLALSSTGLEPRRASGSFSVPVFGLLCVTMLFGFGVLIQFGEEGRLWLTDPRTAYQFYRTGTGWAWLIFQWFLMSAQMYYFWAVRPRLLHALVVTGCFVVAAYFTGSKFIVLGVLVVAIVGYHFLVQKIPTAFLVLIPLPLGVAGVVALNLSYGVGDSFLEGLLYFDYFANSAWFVSRYDEYSHIGVGEGLLSSFWWYVPRAMYPDKPYEYGDVLIHSVLFPGFAEQTHTPGILAWSIHYLDFGTLGVFFAGLCNGLFRRVSFEYFLKHPASLAGFLLMLQFSIWQVWQFATVPITLVLTAVVVVLVTVFGVGRNGSELKLAPA